MNFKQLLFALSLLLSIQSFAQHASVHGKVTAANGHPVSSISVTLLNTRWGTTTNDNGEYNIRNIKPGTYTIQLSYTGDIRKTQSITLAADSKTELDFTIEHAARQLEEVIVETNKIMNRAGATANKLNLSAMETPQIVNTISNVTLRKQNAMTLEDAMKNAVGMTKLWDATSRPDGGSFFVSRGFQTVTKARNGLPNIVNTNVDLANLEAIEVIKGPSATMFGSIITSYGGLVNRVTKKPGFQNQGYADISYGSYNMYRASVDYNYVIKPGKMAARINAAGQNQDSWQEAGFQRSYIIAPSFLYKPDDRFSLNVDAEIVGSRGNSNGGNFMFVLTPTLINNAISGLLALQGYNPQQIAGVMSQAPKTFKQAFGTDRVDELKTDYNRSFLNDDLYATTNSNAFFADASYKISKHWTSQTAITYSNSRNNGYTSYQYLLPNYASNFIRTGSFGTAGHDSLGRMVWNPVGETNTFNVQQNFVSDYTFGKIRNRAVIGLDYAHYKTDLTYNRYTGYLFGVAPYPDLFDVVSIDGLSPKMNDFNKPNVLNAFATRPPQKFLNYQKFGVMSAYLNNVTNITDYILVSAGLRIDNYRNEQLDEDQTKLSPKFGLVVMPIKDKLTLFANYQNGFTNKFGADQYNKAFKPEQANQTEFGVKYSLFNNKLSGSIAYYNIRVNDIIRANPNDPIFDIQDGDQKSKGVEVEIAANPVIGWTVLLGYGYNDIRFIKGETDVMGRRPVGSGPYSTGNFFTNYTFTKTSLKGLGIGLSINYAGETYAFNSNNDGSLILPDYTIIGTHLTYDTDRFRFGVKVNNIADEKYWMGWNSYIPQMRRQLIGTVTVKF